MRKYSLLLPLALLSLILLAGCGASPEEQLRSNAGKMLDAMEQRDGKAFCDLLDSASQKTMQQLGGPNKHKDCAAAANFAFKETDSDDLQKQVKEERPALDKAQIEIRGDRGTIKLPDEEPLVAHRVDGKWRFQLDLDQ